MFLYYSLYEFFMNLYVFLKPDTFKSLMQYNVVMYQDVFCVIEGPCIIIKVGAKEVVVSVKLKIWRLLSWLSSFRIR